MVIAVLPGRAMGQCQVRWDDGFGVPGVPTYPVYCLGSFDDGGGRALYVGGRFETVGGVTANTIAKWDGATWSALGSGTNTDVRTMVEFDDGSGAALYVASNFTTAGGVNARDIAKWNGSTWSAVGSGMDGINHSVSALAVFNDGGGPALYAGGDFSGAGGVAANNIAKRNGTSWSPLGS